MLRDKLSERRRAAERKETRRVHVTAAPAALTFSFLLYNLNSSLSLSLFLCFLLRRDLPLFPLMSAALKRELKVFFFKRPDGFLVGLLSVIPAMKICGVEGNITSDPG